MTTPHEQAIAVARRHIETSGAVNATEVALTFLTAVMDATQGGRP